MGIWHRNIVLIYTLSVREGKEGEEGFISYPKVKAREAKVPRMVLLKIGS
jgi:hypothetical protein